jgi:hypothetical protein
MTDEQRYEHVVEEGTRPTGVVVTIRTEAGIKHCESSPYWRKAKA